MVRAASEGMVRVRQAAMVVMVAATTSLAPQCSTGAVEVAEDRRLVTVVSEERGTDRHPTSVTTAPTTSGEEQARLPPEATLPKAVTGL